MIVVFLALLSSAFITTAGAVELEDALDIQSLPAALDSEAQEYMPDISPFSVPDSGVLSDLFQSVSQRAGEEIASVCKTAGLMLTVCVLVAVSNTLDTGNRAPQYIVFAAVAAIGAAAMTDFDSYLRLSLDCLDRLAEYSQVIIPVLASAAAATGAVGSAAAKYGATTMFVDLLLRFARSVIVPCVCGYAALAIADAAVGNEALKTAKKMIKTLSTALLSGLSLGFTAWITLSGIISGAADSFTSRITKTAVSAALPVVGGILSDAAGTLSAAVGTLLSSVGVFGLIAVICICLSPMIALGARYIAYKLSAVLCQCVSDKRLSVLVEDLGACFGMLLGLNGAGAIMLFISIYSLLRTVV